MKSHLITLGLWIFTALAHADEPLPPAKDHTVRSRNGRFEARVTLSPPETRVYPLSKPSKLLWRKPGFHRRVYLADDGRHLIAAYSGSNLIPLKHTPDLVLLEFFDGAKSVRKVRLGDIVPYSSKLRRTVSHFRWGSFSGIDRSGFFLVTTVDGRLLKFDVATGMLRSEERLKR